MSPITRFIVFCELHNLQYTRLLYLDDTINEMRENFINQYLSYILARLWHIAAPNQNWYHKFYLITDSRLLNNGVPRENRHGRRKGGENFVKFVVLHKQTCYLNRQVLYSEINNIEQIIIYCSCANIFDNLNSKTSR